MKDELKRAVEAAKSRVELHSKGFGHREETAFLATHGDALIAAVEFRDAYVEMNRRRGVLHEARGKVESFAGNVDVEYFALVDAMEEAQRAFDDAHEALDDAYRAATQERRGS